MSHFLLSLRARKLDKLYSRYKREKINAAKIYYNLPHKYTLCERLRHCCFRTKRSIKARLRRLFCGHPDGFLSQFFTKLFMDGTYENYLAKSFIGFSVGVFLTYLFFLFFAFQLHFSLESTTMVSGVLGVVLTIGLAFSQYVRCIVLLILPQLCTKRGRQALLMYCFVLTLAGPARNALRNVGVLGDSLACGQEQIKAAARQIIEAVKKPFLAIKDAVKKVIATIKSVIMKIKEALMAIKRLVVAILKVIKTAMSWLVSIVNICNKKMGTPYDRCMRSFEPAVVDCLAALGPLFSWLCSVVYVGQALCYVLKPLDLICILIRFIGDTIVSTVGKKLKQFLWSIKNAFYVSFEFHHSYDFKTEQSKSLKNVASDIIADVRGNIGFIANIFDRVSFVTSLFFFIVIIKALLYWRRFMTDDRFDNKFITNDFFELDQNRARLKRDTILPLNNRERIKYIYVSSLRLVKEEKVKLGKSAIFLSQTTLKIAIHMVIDYSLFWVLEMIKKHGRFTRHVGAPRAVDVGVEGSGFLADIYRAVMTAFKPFNLQLTVDTVPCLPEPIPPNLYRYAQIGFLVLLCWLLAVAEPYTLRMRHLFMCYYYPIRARQRSVWLYNHILRSRQGFLKFARRMLRRKYAKHKFSGQSFMDRVRDMCPWPCYLLMPPAQESCILCAHTSKDLVKCPKYGCPGRYCQQCFADLKNLCTICLQPVDYGDLSDISEEKGSSEEDSYQGSDALSKTQHHVDNGATSDSGESEYSQEYQYQEESNVSQRNYRQHFRDVEAQNHYDPASLQQFATDSDNEYDKTIKIIYRKTDLKHSKQKITDEEQPLIQSSASDESS